MARTIFKEDFEGEKVAGKTNTLGDFTITDGRGNKVTTGRDNPTKVSDFFTISNSNDSLSGDYLYKQASGKFLASNDLDSIDGVSADDTRVLTAKGIDISGQKGLEFSIDLAQTQWRFSPTTKITDSWEADTSLIVEVSIDGGKYKQIFGVEEGKNSGSPRIDGNLDGFGEGAEISDVFKTYTAAFSGTGKSLDLRISHKNSNDKFEDIAIDNIIISSSGSGGTPSPTPPAPEPTPEPVDAPTPSGGTIQLAWSKTDYKGTSGADIYIVDRIADSTTSRLDKILSFSPSQGDRIDLSDLGVKGDFKLVERGTGESWVNTRIEGPGDFELRVNEKLTKVASGLIYGTAPVKAEEPDEAPVVSKPPVTPKDPDGDVFVFDDPSDSTKSDLQRIRTYDADQGDLVDLSALGSSDDFSLTTRGVGKSWEFVRIDGPDGFRLRVDGELDEVKSGLIYDDTIL